MWIAEFSRTTTLRVVGGDEIGSLKSETVKYGRKYQGTRVKERLRWQGPAARTNDRSVLLSERAPRREQDRNCDTVINILSWTPDEARHQDLLTDWPSVAMWLWLWFWERTILHTAYQQIATFKPSTEVRLCNYNKFLCNSLISCCLYIHRHPKPAFVSRDWGKLCLVF
jgi:hypothetical protein